MSSMIISTKRGSSKLTQKDIGKSSGKEDSKPMEQRGYWWNSITNPITAERTVSVMAMATRMVPYIRPSGLSTPPMPQMSTPARLSTPGASSNCQGHLAFSPGMTTPQCSPGNGDIDW
eukprot:2970622-Prorocentrum_lima.AAC.1